MTTEASYGYILGQRLQPSRLEVHIAGLEPEEPWSGNSQRSILLAELNQQPVIVRVRVTGTGMIDLSEDFQKLHTSNDSTRTAT